MQCWAWQLLNNLQKFFKFEIQLEYGKCYIHSAPWRNQQYAKLKEAAFGRLHVQLENFYVSLKLS